MRERRTHRGFTILEIMISVLILGLGLLGLGALFPVVIRSQRVAQDETYGTMAADAAVASLRSTNFMGALTPSPMYRPRTIWHLMRGYTDPMGNYQQSRMGGPEYQHGQWYVPPIGNVTNELVLGGTASVNQVRLPVRERLYPQGSPHLAQPQFVWDLAVQRVDDGVRDGNNPLNNASTDAMRVAVFVRRLDLRMRPAMGRTVYAAVADDMVPSGERLRPVGVNMTTGLPTGDGTGNYAAPFTMPVEMRNDALGRAQRDRLYVATAATPEQWAIIRQVGQKLVDNLGNIHTVTGSELVGTDRYVKLEAPIPASVQVGSWADGVDLLNEVVLTPQVPVAVRVFRVER